MGARLSPCGGIPSLAVTPTIWTNWAPPDPLSMVGPLFAVTVSCAPAARRNNDRGCAAQVARWCCRSATPQGFGRAKAFCQTRQARAERTADSRALTQQGSFLSEYPVC